MEASNSEAVFESFNLNPQLFINEVLNGADDLQDEAFNFFLQEAAKLLKIEENTDRSAKLSEGVANIRGGIQQTLDSSMQKWEEYCLRYCFRIPEGFSLPRANEPSGDDLPDIDAFTDAELDAQLNSLREKLAAVGKESEELGKQLRVLERQSLSSNQSAGLIDEALQLYEKQDTNQMLHELTTLASKFRSQLDNMKRKRMEEIRSDRADRLRIRQGDLLGMAVGNGLFGAELEELQQFVDEITPP